MENKLQELTRKLYDEGLEKGRAEADKLVADARREAEKDRLRRPERGRGDRQPRPGRGRGCGKEHPDGGRAGGPAGRCEDQVGDRFADRRRSYVRRGETHGSRSGVHPRDAALDGEELDGRRVGQGGADGPAARGGRAQLDKAFDACAKELLSAGVEVGWSKQVKTGFKVGPKEGGYYISFSDADLEALLSEYLREKVSRMLFKA